MLLLVAVGCMTHRAHNGDTYTYTPPVTVTCVSLEMTNGYCFAYCILTNVSPETVWFDAWDEEHPIYSIQSKERHYWDSEWPGEGSDVPVMLYKLFPGQSRSFNLIVGHGVDKSKPFRVGFWIRTALDKTIPVEAFWSNYMTNDVSSNHNVN